MPCLHSYHLKKIPVKYQSFVYKFQPKVTYISDVAQSSTTAKFCASRFNFCLRYFSFSSSSASKIFLNCSKECLTVAILSQLSQLPHPRDSTLTTTTKHEYNYVMNQRCNEYSYGLQQCLRKSLLLSRRTFSVALSLT